MNIALIYFCNQRCVYCFARDAMPNVNTPEAREMTTDNPNKIMDFMKRSKVSDVYYTRILNIGIRYHYNWVTNVLQLLKIHI